METDVELTAESWPASIESWLAAELSEFTPPYRFNLVPAGGSNLTYIVNASNNQRFVVRRPPLRARLATAHDMGREYRIMNALKDTAVPVPNMLAYCRDRNVCDVDFFCMAMVEGMVIRESKDVVSLSSNECLRATESLIDAQVAFHTIDLDSVGLSDLARHDEYLLRQLKRWKKQVDSAAARDVPILDQLHRELLNTVPTSLASPGLAHGDYRFDNTILNPNFTIAAVLDWELCTIGDPIADFIWSLNYWAEPGESLYWLMDPPTLHPSFPSRRKLIELYQQRSGLDVETHYGWYQTFSWWKQACIVEGVYARLLKGGRGGMKVAAPKQVARRVDEYLNKAVQCAELI